MIKKILLASLLILGIVSISISARENLNTPDNLSKEDKLYGLSLFWKEASYNFAFFDQVPELNFDKAYREFIPKVLATETTYEYYRELMKFNALLKDGHTNIYLPKGLSSKSVDWPALNITEANHQAVVTKVGRELQNKIPLGSTIISVEGVNLETHLKTHIMPYIASSTEHILWNNAVRNMLNGTPNTKVNVSIKTPSGELKDLTLTRNSRHKKADKISLKQPSSNGELFEFKWLDNKVAYISLNGFHDEKILQDFNGAYKEIKQSKGLIIDLRFNGGGNTSIAAEILSHFTNKDLEGSIWKTRKHIAAYKAWGNYSEKYKDYTQDNAWESGPMELLKAKDNNHIVPTYILIGRHTASAAEDFLIYADKLKHFSTIGEKTYGSTGQPIFFDLPGGGSLRICAKRDTYPDGREFVGYGISPKIVINRMPEHLKSEKDIVLTSAIQKLKTKI
ncbi:peptidase S41 [Shewanella sp. Choline-02u-19]|jgi:carboxyl-terminal processing protease|uniref:S41 family peptidase n=1 Tax=unclassified Shewanella TaxID=196818 RepID=UPI000C32440E|nr:MULTISPECIES: S41 family peptidase [unclassified Shewanella]PKH57940.1 peptidase S41 [Shewanella sp. Bg11-22]PKI27511.1 peptidase S41 [Shewanella sp. Choline-02u-19]